ncbi:M16 family metallopeptidase [Parachitinimonas caeni]|uniref:Pitrilysin family protein n=1 Tax=Parachitinimonas caeni TaxID=3031301 RepID=A0ABT7DY35_9NEIS|nr:pitrilysin family protein [Parachitinimonas caeni]MDK2124075.1 pitrilysin family protein [Parachitinimonas caeni]
MNWKTRLLAGSLGLAMLAGPVQALTVDKVNHFTLGNGMKFLVVESRAIPNANFYVFWKVGSRNEALGATGLSHFFEHMMFNGASKYGVKQFDRVMEAKGGTNNAYTTTDVTVYTNWFPATSLETIFDLEGDRIASLTIDPKMVESERGVVISERTTGLENSNFRMLDEEVMSVAFLAHPYSWPVLGFESDIKAWTQADLRHYFDTYYAPNNAVTVVVGDVTFDQVKKFAEQYIGPIPARAKPPAVRTVEPEQRGERRVFVKKASVTTPNLQFAFKTPAINHPDYYALEVLQSILAEGKTSRLYRALVDQRLATEVEVYAPETFDPGVLNVFVVAAEGVSAAKLEKATLAEMDKLVRNGISEQELQKVRKLKLIQYYRQLETINGQASLLGKYETFFGDYRKLFDAPKAYEALSVADIKAVAAKYLKKSQRTVGVLAAKEE